MCLRCTGGNVAASLTCSDMCNNHADRSGTCDSIAGYGKPKFRVPYEEGSVLVIQTRHRGALTCYAAKIHGEAEGAKADYAIGAQEASRKA
jgi:hypothetical protein